MRGFVGAPVPERSAALKPGRGWLDGARTRRQDLAMSKPEPDDRARAPARPRLSEAGEAACRAREARLAEALRANLRRRKAALEARASGAPA